MTSITIEATKPLGVKPRDAERSKNFFALGLISWMYTRPTEPTHRVDREAVREQARRCSRRTSPRSGRATTSARPPSCSTTRTRSSPRTLRAGRVPQHHRQRRAVVRARRRRAAGEAAARSTRRTRSRRPPTSCTSCRSTRTSVCARCRPRTRSRPSASRSAPRSPGTSAITATSGPGVDLKSETIGLAVSLELPLLHRRRAARRPVDRPADQDRAGRPACSRCTAATARRRCRSSPRSSPSRLLRRRDRGGAHRAEVPHAGDPAHRRLPRQRRRAVAAPRRRRAARHLGAVRDRAEPRRRVLAVPARPRDARAAVGDPGHARARCTASVASRRKTAPATSATTPRTTSTMVRLARREDRRHRQRHPARRASTIDGRRRAARARLGRARGARSTAAVRRVRARGQQGRARAPRAPEPVPARTSATCCAATRRCSCPR